MLDQITVSDVSIQAATATINQFLANSQNVFPVNVETLPSQTDSYSNVLVSLRLWFITVVVSEVIPVTSE